MSHEHDEHGHCGNCGGGGHEHGHEHGEGHSHHHDAVAGPGEELVTCAVRGNLTVKSDAEAAGLARDHEGVTYYFCCAHCAEMFDADPAAYTITA